MGDVMKRDGGGEPRPQALDARLVVAFAYCALALTLIEYWFLPSRVLNRGWFAGASSADAPLFAALTWAGVTITLFLVIPVGIVRIWHRESLASVGFSTTGVARHVPIYLGLFALMVPVIWFASRQPAFLATYPFVRRAAFEWRTFLIWESAYVLQFVALEAFFRGYVLFTARRRLGAWPAAAACAVPYTMIHFHKPPLECLGALGAGFVLALLALRFRSFWGGVLLHALVAVGMDLLAALRLRS